MIIYQKVAKSQIFEVHVTKNNKPENKNTPGMQFF